MKKREFDAVTRPVSSLAFAWGLARGFAASVLRVAAGEKGPVMPGFLPGPIAGPVEEGVCSADQTCLVEVDGEATPEDHDG